MFDVFSSERAVKEFVQKDRTFAQKVVDHIKSIIADIKNIFNKLVASGNYDEITAWQSDMEALDKLNNMMLDALAEIEQSETQAQKNTSEEVNNVLFSVKRFTLTEGDIHKNMLLVGSMDNVVDLSGNEFAKGSVGLPDQVDAFFAKYNYSIENPDIGDVEMNRRGAKDSMAHGIGRVKATSFAAVPYTIEKGKIIDYQKNWKGRQYDTIVLAAPISINDKRYYQGVIVIRDVSTQRFYLHEVLTEKESDTSFKTGAGAKHTPGDVSPSLISLLEKVRDVNKNVDDTVFSTKRDAEQKQNQLDIINETNPAQSKYENDVDAVINGTYNSDSALIMGVTPQIYQELGFSKLPIAITKNHVYSIAVTEQQAKADGRYNKNVNYHGLGVQAVKDIYQNISDPIMVIASPDFQSKTQRESVHKVIAIVDLQVGGKQVIAPIEIDAEVENNNFERIDVNLVSSYFDKSNLNKMLSEAVAQESTGNVGFYYVDKKRAENIFKKSKVQYLSRLDSLNSNDIIHKIDEKVNRKIDDVLKSKQFIRWFGDWQNKPETASKIVNADGTPKVMYHGTQSSFTAFDKKKAKSYGYYGKGFYFTDSESHAKQYGDSMAVYLDVKNPLEQGKNSISKKQLRKFLEAVAENEDYDIWNYGTEDISEIIDGIYKNDAFSVIQDVNATAIGDFAEAIALFNKVNKTSYDGIVTPTETVVYEPTQIKSATDNIGTFDRNNDDIRFSAKRDFAKQLDGWDGKTEGFAFVIGRVSKPLLEAGIPNKQIRIDASKVKKTIDKHSGMTMEQFKTIPQLLEEPIFVIESKSDTDSKVVMGDLYDANGKIVTVVLKLSPSSRKGNILDVLKISSAEGRSHINSLFRYEDGTPVKVLYEDKKRAQNWLNVNRLQLPLRSPNMNSNNIIAEYDENVNDDKNFSIKRDRSISEDASNYILDTKEYKEAMKLVDQRYRLTGKKKLDARAIDRFAGRLLSKSQSQYSREQLTERLSALFDYIANSGN